MKSVIRTLPLFFLLNWQICVASEGHLEKFKNIRFSVGNWYEFIGSVKTDNGKRSVTNLDFVPFLAVSSDYALSPKWSVNPEFAYVVRQSAGDSKISKDIFVLRTDFAYILNQEINIRMGSSFIIQTMSSDGSEATVNNGNSTEIYYRPNSRSTSLNQTLDLGLEYLFEKVSIRPQVFIYAPFVDDERQYTFTFSLSYLLPVASVL